ncbi:Uncharacterized protein pbN1_17750 [Aromatoleum bremense]|nr:Uncharacterized protein pbN1_17750 [Aromatoleum bremense]
MTQREGFTWNTFLRFVPSGSNVGLRFHMPAHAVPREAAEGRWIAIIHRRADKHLAGRGITALQYYNGATRCITQMLPNYLSTLPLA